MPADDTDRRMASGPPAGPATADAATQRRPGSAGSRIAWFVGLWIAGFAAVGAVAFVIRWALGL